MMGNDKPNLDAVTKGNAKEQPTDKDHRDDMTTKAHLPTIAALYIILLSEDRIQHPRKGEALKYR